MADYDRTNREKRRKKRAVSAAIRWGISLLILVITIVLAIYVYQFVYHKARGFVQENKSTTSSQQTTEMVQVTIPQGASTKDIAAILKDAGLIDSEFMFRIKSRLGDYDGTFHQGVYEVAKGMTEEEMMDLFQSGAVMNTQIKVTIPEGYTIAKIGALLEEKGIVSAEEFSQAANSLDYPFDFLKDVPQRENQLEGYLFPDTYFFEEDTTAQEIVTAMLNGFQTVVYTQERQQAVAESEYTLDQLLTVASMVEAEIQVPEERSVAAQVMYNRLKTDMPLQIDSTVQYALGTRNEQVTYDDLEVDSPYNTYKHKGLPLGPILGKLRLKQRFSLTIMIIYIMWWKQEEMVPTYLPIPMTNSWRRRKRIKTSDL